MTAKTIGYWAATGLFAFALSGSAFLDLTMPEEFKAQLVGHLGYPAYFPPILGVWKVLGVVALLAPGFGRLKEWAYAGFVFNLTGAIASHLAIGDGVGGALPPAVLLTLLTASYVLRPPSRVLGQLPTFAGEPAPARAAGY
jgi:hypothetical protein